MRPSDHHTWLAGKSIIRPSGPGWAMQKQKVMTSIDNNKTPRNKNIRTRTMLGDCWVLSSYIMDFHGLHTGSCHSHWAIEEKRVLIWSFLKMGGTPKSSILIRCSIKKHIFWGTTIYGKPPYAWHIWLVMRIRSWSTEPPSLLKGHFCIVPIQSGGIAGDLPVVVLAGSCGAGGTAQWDMKWKAQQSPSPMSTLEILWWNVMECSSMHWSRRGMSVLSMTNPCYLIAMGVAVQLDHSR